MSVPEARRYLAAMPPPKSGILLGRSFVQTRQVRLESETGAKARLAELRSIEPTLVLVFASARHMASPWLAANLGRVFPDARRVGCSSAGEISDEGVSAGSVVVTAVRLDASQFEVASA
jgi:hypothetical protein